MADDDKKKGTLPEGFVLDQDRDYPEGAPQTAAPTRPPAPGRAAALPWLTEKAQPGQPEKVRSPMGQLQEGWEKAKTYFAPYRAAEAVSKGLTGAAGYLRGKEQERQTAEQGAIARGEGEPGTLAKIGRGARTYYSGALADQLGAAGALTSPRSLAIAAGTAAMPAIGVPALIAQGGQASIAAWHKGQKEGWTADNIQDQLTALGGTALAAAGLGELLGRGAVKPSVKAEAETLPRTEAPRGGGPPAGGGPGTVPEIPPAPKPAPRAAVPSAAAQLDAAAMAKFGKPYDALQPEEKVVAARDIRPEGAERRVVRGQGPTAERRAEAMPLPTKAPGAPTGAAPAEPFEIANKMGIRWATNWGGPDISIPNRMTDPAEIQRYVAEKQALQRTGMAARGIPSTPAATPSPGPAVPQAAPSQEMPRTSVPPRPAPTTLPSTPAARAGQPAAPGAPTVPPATLDEILRQATGQKEPPKAPPGRPLRGPGIEEERPPPVTEPRSLKDEFPDSRVRQYVHANGVELGRSGVTPEVMAAVHDLKNYEVRQAAINAGIDVGQKHVGSRAALGPEQVARQDLIDQMIRQGVRPEDIPRLAKEEQVPYTRAMPIGGKRMAGFGNMTAEDVLHHEWAHVIISMWNGIRQYGIASHRFPGTLPSTGASALLGLGHFRDIQGNFSTHLVLDRAPELAEVFAAGAAGNELVSGLARNANRGLMGDIRLAEQLFKAYDLPVERWTEAWNLAIDRAKAKLSVHPGIADIIREESRRREDNLPVEYHASQARVDHVGDRVKALLDEARAQEAAGTSGAAPGVAAGGYPGSEAVNAGRESQGPRVAPAPALKPYGPPKNTYTFEIRGGGEPRTVTLEALNRKKAFELVQKQNPSAMEFEMTAEKPPEVQQVFAQRKPLGKKEVDEWFKEHNHLLAADQLEAIQNRPQTRRNVIKEFEKLNPSIDEVKNAIRAGHGFGGWWQRFIDTFHALGEDTSEIERLGPAHEDALKAFHSAVSGNKLVEEANPIAWKAYRDWLREGRPRDLQSINAIAKRNRAVSGEQGLDTQKLYKLVNSPQFRDIDPAPFTGEAFVRSPVYGTSPGTQKIPSMTAGTAGTGKWWNVVIDTHMKHLYGWLGMSDAQYIAASMHIREAGAQIGLRAMEAQEQMWGTVLGLKYLMKQGMSPRQAAQEFGKATLQAVGKDYAAVVRDSFRDDPEVQEAIEDMKEWGLDITGEKAMKQLADIVERGQARLQERARPINRRLLERTARRIQETLARKAKAGSSSSE